MDILQIAIIALIAILTLIMLVLGVQVFLILRDLRQSLDKLEQLIADAAWVAQKVEGPIKGAAQLVSQVEDSVKELRVTSKKGPKPSKRLFKRQG